MEQENATKISQEEIHKFIEGHDPEERIVNLSYNSEDNFITIHYRDKNDVKRTRQQPFYPFCWATLKACKRLCGGNRQELLFLMEKYGIGCKKLSQTSITGEVRSEFDDGYLFMFYAKRPISYRLFSAFFKKARNPLYPKKDDGVKVPKEIEKQYLVASPQEQFLISTGKRFFKGYDDYDQILRMIFDIESTGLDTKKDRINQIGIRTNRPSPGFPNGLEIILTSDGGETEEEKDASELWIINEFLKYISLVNPDVITAHNGEAFDWNIILGACERMGVSIEKLCEPHFGVGKYIYKSTKNTILKLGGEIETYNETIVPNIIVTDSLHAVRRAQALDSNMLRADLKYVTEYSKMKKENRVYVPGGKISETWNDTAYQYALNNKNGDWYKYDPTMEDKDDGEDFVGKKSFIPVHGFLREGYELKSGKYIVERYLLDDLYECDKVEHRYNITNFLICKLIPVPYKKCTTMGTAGQWKSLMLAWSYEHNLAIPMFAERKSFTGGLSRLLTTGYVENVIKLDYNSLYPSIILTWGISAGIDLMGATLSFLEHILTQREEFKIAKKKAGKLKEKYKAQIEAGTATKSEMDELQRLKDKAANEEAFNDKKQLPFKIFGNSFFGSYGAPNVFPWGSIKCAEQITCTGRQSLRLMISHFRNLGYLPIVGDTDGFNFKLPNNYRYTEESPYISTGESRETEKGKAYSGFKADVAEFNDKYMKDFHYGKDSINKMGLGIDEVVDSTINFSRKNYADYFPENPYPEDVKLVGNTVKSKKMPEYISKFLAVGIRLLLQGKGQEFLNEYYNYIEKIYNYQIPLRDIATKGKIKKSLKEYSKDVMALTKAGRPKSRQAWYELAIKNNLTVSMGETIYYINTGSQKSHSDIKKVTNYYSTEGLFNEKKLINKDIDKAWKEKKNKYNTKEEMIRELFPKATKEEVMVFNSELIPRDIIDREEDTFCSDISDDFEYNVAKYIDMFNKRITPILVCFKKDIRSKILITNPKDRPYFTVEEAELTSGEPNKPTDQDTYEQIMTMEDKEIKFWVENNLIPPFYEESGMGKWEDTVAEYNNRMEIEKQNGIAEEKQQLQTLLESMTQEEANAFVEEADVPASILKIADVDYENGLLISKKLKAPIGNLFEIYDQTASMLEEGIEEVSNEEAEE